MLEYGWMRTVTRFFEGPNIVTWESITTGIPGDDEIGAGLDTVTVDGREWAQVDQFTNLSGNDINSWSDINAVCPAGVCSGVLNGYNMTGWTWASVDDVNALFNHYIGSDELGPGTYRYPDLDCSVVRDFFSDGWRPYPLADGSLALAALYALGGLMLYAGPRLLHSAGSVLPRGMRIRPIQYHQQDL